MNQFLLGMLVAFSTAIAVLFLKLWHQSRDRLFGFFSAAFAVLAIDWLVHAVVKPQHESQHLLFLIRLVAFLLIIAGIISKNRSRS